MAVRGACCGALALMLMVLPHCGQGLRSGASDGGGGTEWASAALEALDERRDAEIFQAVVTSMAEWQRRRDGHRERRAADSVVCYEDVGCFRDSGPFGYLDMLPSPPDQVATQFLFYSRQRPHGLPLPFANISEAARRPARDIALSSSLSTDAAAAFVPSTSFGPADWLQAGLNVSAPTKVIVHGFGSSCSNVWVFEMRSALMSVEECNVICVDWEAGATIPNYVRASANTRLVGKQLAMLLARLRDELQLDLRTVHLIGFSLGAHVAGFAGAELRNLSRITGLDPAGPLFENQDPAARLDAGDASFVDVIHSNGENLILGGLGSWQPMGHVDFYPNGGRMQKGCSNLFVGAVSDIFWSTAEAHGRSLCNHRRAYKFFTDSVSPRCLFPAVPCDSYEKFLEGQCFPCPSQGRCGNMGYYADRSPGRGDLYLITRDDEPFCAHQFLLRVESSPSALPVVSYGKIQVTLLGVTPEANETFTMTRKDDEELKAGGSLSRIVVPHPVMDEPAKVELEYAAYSGWISSGLAKWSVDKVTLTDSFGKSLSFCRKGLILESGVPVRVPLFPGDCNPPGDETTSPAPVSPTPDQEWTKKKDEEEVTVPAKPDSVSEVSQEATEATADASSSGDSALDGGKEKAVEELTSNEALKAIKGGQTTTEGQPQPVTRWDDSNGLGPSDGSREDGARALEGPRRPFPLAKREWKPRHIPVYGSPLMDPRGEWHREMASPEMDPPPIYAPLTWQHWIGGEAEAEAEEKRGDDPRGGNSSGPALVQLLPQRLASFLARAEEYARVTLSGVMAVGGNSSDVARRPKYFPVAAMGRGQAHYYSGRAVVGQGSERALEVQHPRYIPLRRPVPPRGALMVPRR